MQLTLTQEAQARRVPPAKLPSKPEDMVMFGDRLGIKWKKHKAIGFWPMCLCAYEVQEGLVDTTVWFHAKETAVRAA